MGGQEWRLGGPLQSVYKPAKFTVFTWPAHIQGAAKGLSLLFLFQKYSLESFEGKYMAPTHNIMRERRKLSSDKGLIPEVRGRLEQPTWAIMAPCSVGRSPWPLSGGRG